jgi:hypothetical protein
MGQDETAQISGARRRSGGNESGSNRDGRHLHRKLCVRVVVQGVVQTLVGRDHAFDIEPARPSKTERRLHSCPAILMLKSGISNPRDKHSIIAIDDLHRHAMPRNMPWNFS